MNIKRFYTLGNLGLKEFTEELIKATEEMQDNGLDVEVQFSKGEGYKFSALLIGRARWEVDK